MDLESVRVVVVEKMTLCNLSLVLAVPCFEILRRKTWLPARGKFLESRTEGEMMMLSHVGFGGSESGSWKLEDLESVSVRLIIAASDGVEDDSEEVCGSPSPPTSPWWCRQ